MDSNEEDGVIFAQPGSLQERSAVAQECCSSLGLSMPCLVDTLDNRVDDAYAGWPERLFIVDVDGRVVYAGEPGPWGFEPDDIESWLVDRFGKR